MNSYQEKLDYAIFYNKTKMANDTLPPNAPNESL